MSSTTFLAFDLGAESGRGILGSFDGQRLALEVLHRFPNVGRVYVTVRARSQEESETRFWNNVITAPPFDPLLAIFDGEEERDERALGRIFGEELPSGLVLSPAAEPAL